MLKLAPGTHIYTDRSKIDEEAGAGYIVADDMEDGKRVNEDSKPEDDEHVRDDCPVCGPTRYLA